MCGLTFYLDECVWAPITEALRRSGHDAVHAIELGHRDAEEGWTDARHLDYAAEENRVLVTHNRRDFRREHERYMKEGREHPGILLLTANAKPQVVACALCDYLGQLEGDLANQCLPVPVPR